MWLRLGAVNTLVISSTSAAEEFFKKHDLSFAGRSINEAMKSHAYNEGSLAIAQYGPRWRMLRRLCVSALIAVKQLNETVSVRRKCVDELLGWIEEEAERGPTGYIEISPYVFMMIFNMMGNLVLSRDLVDPKSKVGTEFYLSMQKLMHWSGLPNVADFFPSLRCLDPQGIRGNMDRDLGRAFEIIKGFIEERMQGKCLDDQTNGRKDFLDVVLEFEGDEEKRGKMSDKDLKEMFLAASDTTNTTTEWAMTELLHNPETMCKAQAELIEVVGLGRKVEESDIDKLRYLKAVVKETMRLHPPIPLLVPRRAVEDVKFMGYQIPKDTQVFVHAWAIGRDSAYWDEPLSFKPERFMNVDLDYFGQHLQFIPFGAGRRMCAGIQLAERVLILVLGSLIHSFDWSIDGTPEDMDMRERIGITLRKAVPLKAKPVPRRTM
ncbi:Cytochrome P450 76A2 [Acorus gramineus]|uniref:Cytochrome P450 76A2 n=1 Tax=Acorus gramineus TaxID=55184 RepID=A0AAV9BIP2_ACOGR|nr:Cytochrome P450 76A2 [Acorus gramineus]